jgi:DNA-binding CsgD family transcriptional regulator
MKGKCKNLDSNQQKKRGRNPIVLTDKQITELETLAKDMTIEQIANYFGFSEDTFHELKKRNIRVFRAYKKGKATGIKEAAGLLWSKMREGDTTATIFYLKTQAGWSEKQQHEITTKGSPPILTYVVQDDKEKSS